jgi:polymorphic toxin system DSP-PTPase phosphatase-like protein
VTSEAGGAMFQRFFWIECGGPGRLAIVVRPAAESLADEVAAWRDAGVTVVASLLEPAEAWELGLGDEGELCRGRGIEFTSFPIADCGVPASLADTVGFVRRLAHVIEAGGTVGVHCRASIGRSGMIATAILMALGNAEDRALAGVAAGRGLNVPETPEQRAFVSLAGRELGQRR